METVVNEQIKEMKEWMDLSILEEDFIRYALQIAYAEGERAKMVKQMEELKNK
jgi:hypothetical protein